MFSARWTTRFCHVLREDVARPNTFYENRAEVANQRRNKILRLQGICTTHGCRLLAQRTKNTTDHFCLPVEIHKPFFDETRQLQITIEFEMLRGFERGLRATA